VRALGRLLYRGRRSEVRPVLRRTSLRVCVCVWKPRSPNDSPSAAPCRCVQCCNLEVQTTCQAQHRVAVSSVAKDFAACVSGNLELQTKLKRLAKRSTVSLCPVLRRTSLRVRQPYLEAQSVQVQDAVPVRLTIFGSSTGRGNDLVKRSKGQRVMATELSQKTSSVNSTGSYKSPAKSWNDQSQYVNSR